MERKDLERLEQAGLLIGEQISSCNLMYPNGYSIGKPKSVNGNFLDYMNSYWYDNQQIDAPSCCLHEEEGKYIFSVLEYRTWPIDEKFGDFRKKYNCLEDSITAILEYYFGDPTDMYRKYNDEIFNEWKKTRRPINEILEEWRKNNPPPAAPPFVPVSADSLYIDKVVKDGNMWRVTIKSTESTDFIDEFKAATEEKAYQNGQRSINQAKNLEKNRN